MCGILKGGRQSKGGGDGEKEEREETAGAKGWEGNVKGVCDKGAEKRVRGIDDGEVAAQEVATVGDTGICGAAQADQCGRFVTAPLASLKPLGTKLLT